MRAFTLLELLIVVTLIGLLAGLATLSLTSRTDGARLRGAALQIEQTLRRGQFFARTRFTPIWLEFDVGSNRHRLRRTSPRMRGLAADPEEGAWKTLVGVTVGSVRYIDHRDGASNRDHVRLRILPSGATLPWEIELRAGEQRRMYVTDGISGVLSRTELIGETQA